MLERIGITEPILLRVLGEGKVTLPFLKEANDANS